MFIKKFNIENFRGIKELEFEPESKMNVIVGPNNIGKSTILHSLDMVLNPYYGWYKFDAINELDFHNKNTDNPIGIEIWLECEKVTCNDCEKRIQTVEVDNETKEIFCPFQEYSLHYSEAKKDFLGTSDFYCEVDFKKIIRIKLKIEWDNERNEIGEPEFSFLNELGEEIGMFTRKYKKWLGFKYISEKEDYKESNTKLSKRSMVSQLMDRTKIANKLKDFFADNRDKLNLMEIQSVKELLEITNDVLQNWNNENYKLIMQIPNESIMDLLPNLGFNVKETNLDLSFPLSRAGDGFKKIIMFVLLNIIIKEKLNTNMILAIEEPESHLDPSNQRWLLRELKNSCDNFNNQLFITSHSLEILESVNDFSSIKICRENKEGKVQIEEISRENAIWLNKNKVRLRKFLSSLYANQVIILEGFCEIVSFPVFFDHLSQQEEYDIEIYNIEYINGKGTNIKRLIKIYEDLNIPMLLFLDNDKDSTESEVYDYKQNDLLRHILLLPSGWAFEKLIARSIIDNVSTDKQYNIIKSVLECLQAKNSKNLLGLNQIEDLIDRGKFDEYNQCAKKYYCSLKDLDKYFVKEVNKDFSEDDLISFLKKRKEYARIITLTMIENGVIPQVIKTSYDLISKALRSKIREDIYVLTTDGSYNKYEQQI